LWADDLLLWQDTAAKSPGKARPWTWLSRIYIDHGKYVQALQALEKGAQVVEPNSDEHAHLLSNTGLAYAHMKDYAKAAEAYRKAIEILPDVPLFQAHLAVALIHGGRNEEGWEEFEKAFATAAKKRGLYPELYLLRGQEHFQEKRYREAVEDFREALRLRPDDARATRFLAAAEEMMRRRGMQ